MAAQKNGSILFYFSIILMLPLSVFLWHTTSKALRVFVSQRTGYVFLDATLTENAVRKYGDHASFKATYNGQVLGGRDRSLLWSGAGDVVRVYFNKKNLDDNGIVSQLISLLISQWLFFMALSGYVAYRLFKNNQQRTADCLEG
jgi:hypothetical protein